MSRFHRVCVLRALCGSSSPQICCWLTFCSCFCFCFFFVCFSESIPTAQSLQHSLLPVKTLTKKINTTSSERGDKAVTSLEEFFYCLSGITVKLYFKSCRINRMNWWVSDLFGGTVVWKYGGAERYWSENGPALIGDGGRGVSWGDEWALRSQAGSPQWV